MIINKNKTFFSNLWFLAVRVNIKTCFMGIFFIFGTTQANKPSDCTKEENIPLLWIPEFSSHLYTFSPTATTSHNTNIKQSWPGLLSNSCPALDYHRNPQWLCKSVIMIVTNEFPKRFGNVKNLIKTISRVMRMPPQQWPFIYPPLSLCSTGMALWSNLWNQLDNLRQGQSAGDDKGKSSFT